MSQIGIIRRRRHREMAREASMKHPSTRELFDYWNARRGFRPAPERSEIEPGAIRRVLADTFILGTDPVIGHPFRIAGTRVCAIFGRELKGVAFTDLWREASRPSVRELLAVVSTETVGVVAGASAHSCEGALLKLEFLALPLAQRDGANGRILGALAPTETPYWLGTSGLGPLTLGSIRYLGTQTSRATAPPPSLTAANARRRHGLVVYDGGHV
jgi:hypothetical protein